jgi:glucose-1-phosphate adenylyltransferase
LSASALFDSRDDPEKGGRVMGKTVALILAGGRGKRMDILCQFRPKPGLPFAGKFQVIDFTLSNCVYSGINDLVILTDYHRSYMADYLKQWGLANPGKTFHILEPKLGSYKGTADAVFQNLTYLNEMNTENVMILAGDHIYRMDYDKMLAFHEQTKAAVTIAVTEVPIEDAHRFGTVALGSNNEVSDFVEKSRNPRSNLASMGIYIFNKDVLAQRLGEDAIKPDSPHDFGYAILPYMLGRDKIVPYEFTGYWQDIGTPQAYYAANMDLICAQPRFNLDGTQPVLTRWLNLPPPSISQGATVVNSLVSPGCVVKGYVENSILSPGVRVDAQAEVWNSMLMPNTFIGYHSVVDKCIIDEGVNIGKMCYIGFGKSSLPGNYDITLLGKGVTVPSNTVIGRDSKVLPNENTPSFRDNPKSWESQEVQRNECAGVYVA